MRIKIELETEEEKTKLSLSPELLAEGLEVTDFPAARGLAMYIKHMQPHNRAKQIEETRNKQKAF